MPIPAQTITIRDPGLGVVEPATSIPLLLGTASGAHVDEPTMLNSANDLVSGWGQGPLVEDGARLLSEAGGPILVCQIDGDVTGTNTSVTKAAVDSSTGTVTLAGEPNDTYDARIEITRTGTLGTAKFRYTLDMQTIDPLVLPTWSPELTVPSGGAFVIPNTGITATFVPGAGAVFFEDGDTHSWTSTEPYYTPYALASAMEAVLAKPHLLWRFASLSGNVATASAAATMAAALGTHLDTAQSGFRYVRGLIDTGSKDDTTDLATSFASFEHRRVGPAYGQVVRTSLKPFVGFATPRRSMVGDLATRAAANLISTHLGRVASGAVSGVRAVSHDEFITGGVDDLRISTMRTWPGRPGFYITRGRLASPPGSDFRFTHNGFVMDVACATVVRAQQNWVAKSFRTTSTGSIDPLDAVDMRQDVLRQLRAQLTEPTNAEGKRGHVSALDYRIDLTANILLAGQVLTEVAIRPLGYAEFFTTQIGFAIDVEEAA